MLGKISNGGTLGVKRGDRPQNRNFVHIFKGIPHFSLSLVILNFFYFESCNALKLLLKFSDLSINSRVEYIHILKSV